MSVKALGMDEISQGECVERLEQEPRRESGGSCAGKSRCGIRDRKGAEDEQSQVRRGTGGCGIPDS